jgi:sec-independent protein translocase protein TatA
VIILWGPSKIPQLAIALGKAKDEFTRASRESKIASLGAPQALTVATSSTIQGDDDLLLSTAKKLGISTEGKSRQLISEEVSLKVKVLGTQ